LNKISHTESTTVLWQQFKAGDRAAFNNLLAQYYPLVLNYGVRLMDDIEFVEDCLQDFFIELWQKRENLGEAPNLKGYLLLSFKRRLIREKQKQNRLGVVTNAVEDYNFDVEFDIETHLIDQEIDTENHRQLKQLTEKLTKRQREALYLRFHQDLSYHEIGELMSINQHSAINLVYDALRLLRQNWRVGLIFFFFYFF
jgi:RNA polymerase sigma factor (sigma-70 family)